MGKRRSQLRRNAALDHIGPTLQAAPAAPPSATGPSASLPPQTERYSGAYAPASPAYDSRGGSLGGLRTQLRDQIEWLEDNPLALTLGSAAVGVLAGLLLPASDAETERLATAGANVAEHVQSHVQALGDDVVEHGKAVVVEAVHASVLGGQNPVDAVQQSVQEHLVTVAQNAQARVEASLGLGTPDP